MIIEIVRKSPFSGKTNVLRVDVTAEEVAAYNAGALIQVAFPKLSADEREFIKTGITAEEWAETFGPG